MHRPCISAAARLSKAGKPSMGRRGPIMFRSIMAGRIPIGVTKHDPASGTSCMFIEWAATAVTIYKLYHLDTPRQC